MLWLDDFSWSYGPLMNLVLFNPVSLVRTKSRQLPIGFQHNFIGNLQYINEKLMCIFPACYGWMIFSWSYGPLKNLVLFNPVSLVSTKSRQLLVGFQHFMRTFSIKSRN